MHWSHDITRSGDPIVEGKETDISCTTQGLMHHILKTFIVRCSGGPRWNGPGRHKKGPTRPKLGVRKFQHETFKPWNEHYT